MPGSSTRFPIDAEPPCPRDRVLEEVDHRDHRVAVAHDLEVERVGPGQERCDDRTPEIGRDLEHGVVLQALGGVDPGRARVEGATHQRRSPRVDAHRPAGRDQRREDRREARPLVVLRALGRLERRALAAEIEGVRTVREQPLGPPCRGDRPVDDRLLVEGVGGGVDDPEQLHGVGTYRQSAGSVSRVGQPDR